MRGAMVGGAEFARIIRFAIVGVGIAALYALLYALFRFAAIVPWLASLAAFAISVATQYVAHARFTFRSPLDAPGQLPRFVASIGLGAVIATLLTGVVGPQAGLPEAVTVAIVVVALPISNFILFRLWVYKPGDDTRTRAMRGADAGAEETGVRRAGGQ